MNPLREAAQQALEALGSSQYPQPRQMAAITNLRAALAQQVEPLNLTDPAIQKRLASQWGYVPAAAQAEPVEPVEPVQEQAEPVPGAWVASPDGRVIYDDVSADDGLLRVSGDFENDEQRIRYAQRIVDALNAAPPKAEPVQEPVAKCIDDICSEHLGRVEAFDHLPKGTLLYTIFPRRTMVPLTEEEIDAEWHELDGRASALFKRVIRKFARAVEKASWEKNNG